MLHFNARCRRVCRMAGRATLSIARFVVEGDSRIGLGKWFFEITRAISWCVLFSFFFCFFPLLTSFSLSGGIAQGGSIELVEWAHKTKKCRKNKQTVEYAAQCGHLDLLKHLRKEKWKIGTSTVMEAARGGQVKCMRYLREEVGIRRWSPLTMAVAARHGHLEAVQYAFEQKEAWISTVACEWAAERGHLNCLKYLHEQGCPWDFQTLRKARARGHMECYNYAKEHGCPER